MTKENAINKKNIVAVRPLTIPQVGFIYNDINDLEKLMKFTGLKPSLNFHEGKPVPQMKKYEIREDSLIIRSGSFGIANVIPMKSIEGKFELSGHREMQEDFNSVQPTTKAKK